MSLCLLSLLALRLTSVYGSTTYCYNEDSCEDEDIDSTVTDCYGYYGCEDANITSTYSYDFGAYSNYGSDCDDKYLWSWGLLSNYYSDVSTYAIWAYGYLAAYYADIEPQSSTLYAYFYGYYSGYYADVLCYSGDTCKVYCGASYGCAELSYYCYSGAYCYYDCANDTSYCPTLYSGVGSMTEYYTGLTEEDEREMVTFYDDLTDEEITAHYMRRRASKEERRGQEESVEQIMASLSATSEKRGYASVMEEAPPKLEIDSLGEHEDRLREKIARKQRRQEEKVQSKAKQGGWAMVEENGTAKWENYGLAMMIDGVLLLMVFGVYNCYYGSKNKDSVDYVAVATQA